MSFQRFLGLILCPLFVLSLSACNLTQFKWGHIGYNTGYAPDQPINFDHKKHVTEYKLACVYCHTQVEYSKHSAVPSLNICMNCHLQVATDKEPIKKLQEKYFAGETVNWVKVHMLPDHVKFNHKRHVHRFSTPDDRSQACKNCHGDVAEMVKIKQVNSLSMGWCVDCHRESTPQGPLNCSTCHH